MFKSLSVGFAIYLVLITLNSRLIDDSLAEIYKTGKVRIIPEATITNDSMLDGDIFESPTDLAEDKDANIYIVDYRANNIKVFDANLKYKKIIGRKGQGPGELYGPAEIDCTSRYLLVREILNRRISFFDLAGHFIRSAPVTSGAGTISKIRAVPDGRILVSRDKAYTSDLENKEECTIELYSSEFEFIKTVYSHAVKKRMMAAGPSAKVLPVPFAADVYWDVMKDGKIALGYSDKYEIEIYGLETGKERVITRRYKPIRITEDDKDYFLKHLSSVSFTDSGASNLRRVTGDLWRLMKFPKYKTAFLDLRVDSEGNIWVGPEFGNPDRATTNYDIFSAAGVFINRIVIKLPEGVIGLRSSAIMRPRGFWLLLRSQMDEPIVVKTRICAL